MSDWRFGDVLVGSGTHPTRLMFLCRPRPYRVNPGGGVVFWGFIGLYLPPDCTDESSCGYSHSAWTRGTFGGHPEARYNSWTVAE